MSQVDYQAAKRAVMEACPYLQKIKAGGLNYTFASEADLIAKLRPAMLANGFTVAPIGMSVVANEDFQTSKGSNMRRVIVQGTYRFTHGPSEQFEDVATLGEGSDVGDKSCNKAMTGALKYALRQWALIETGNDPDTFPSEQMEKFHLATREQIGRIRQLLKLHAKEEAKAVQWASGADKRMCEELTPAEAVRLTLKLEAMPMPKEEPVAVGREPGQEG